MSKKRKKTFKFGIFKKARINFKNPRKLRVSNINRKYLKIPIKAKKFFVLFNSPKILFYYDF